MAFAWANQAGATAAGGGSATLVMTQPAHPGSTNQAALVTPMSSGDACYDTLLDTSDVNGVYNSGMILTSASGVNTVFQNIFGYTNGTDFIITSETDFKGSNSNILNSNPYNGQSNYPIGAEYFQRVCVGGQNVSFEVSPTGTANSFHTILTTTLSALGNPDHVGFYTDADGSNGQTVPSVFQVLHWYMSTSNTPQAGDAGGDLQANFLLVPSVGAGIPISNYVPNVSGDVPKFNLALASSAVNVADLTFPGSGEATITISDSKTFRKYIYVDQGNGIVTNGYNTLIGAPQDFSQGENGPFWGAARTYAAGGANDLIPVTSDGLKVKAHCAGVSYSNCAMNEVRSGAFRLPTDFRPGMTAEMTLRPPTGYHSWTPWWLLSGAQLTSYPNPEGQSPGVVDADEYGSKPVFEVDINDNFPRHDSGGCPIGGQVDFQTPDVYGTTWNQRPNMTYAANSNGWSNQGGNGAASSIANQYECETGFAPGSIRTILLNWRNDGSNLLDIFINGKRVNSAYMEYNQPQTFTYGDGVTRPLGMRMMVGGQTVANFSDDISNMIASPAIVDNDGSAATSPNGDAGWTETIYSLKIWSGNLANPTCCDAGVNAVN